MTDKSNLLNMLDDIEAAIEAESNEWIEDENGVELAGKAELSEAAESEQPIDPVPGELQTSEAIVATEDAAIVMLRPELPDFEFERRCKPERMRRFEGLPRAKLSTRAFVAGVDWSGQS